jgi:hypothetical protein
LSWEWNGGCTIQLNSQAEKRTIWGRDGSKAQRDGKSVMQNERERGGPTAAQTQKALETFSARARMLTEMLKSLKYGRSFPGGEKDTGPSVPSEVEAAEAAAQDALRQWLEDWL